MQYMYLLLFLFNLLLHMDLWEEVIDTVQQIKLTIAIY